MTRQTLLIALALTSLVGSGCDAIKEAIDGEAKAEPAKAAAPTDPTGLACANMEKLVGEPAARCAREMGTFLNGCPDLSDKALACMASAANKEALTACTKPCMNAAADDLAPPVPAEFDTPQLEAACTAMGERGGGSTPAGQEACRRDLAQEMARCPEIQNEMLACHQAAVDTEAGAQCMLTCLESQMKAEARAKNGGKKGKRGK